MTLAFWYWSTRCSKKLALPCREMVSIQSKGLGVFHTRSTPSCTMRRSATNSMYSDMSAAFMPTSAQDSASHTNSFSISTASLTISCSRAGSSGWRSMEYSRHAKSQCRPSSREMSSLEKVRPFMRPRFLSQKMAQKEPLKKMPSTHANATRRSAKQVVDPIHLSAHCALRPTVGTLWMARIRWRFCAVSLMYVSRSNPYVSLWMFSMASWKA
mmetsp:Transcript_8228/g.20399  ORF Transcript_8228/g.20399 Transcript_8228/m.20399 type:complete len:213 (+) Transcript_8228:342-980(+)